MTLYLFCLATKGIFLLLVYGLRKLVQRGEIEMPSEKTLSAKKERVAQLVEMLKNSAAGVSLITRVSLLKRIQSSEKS